MPSLATLLTDPPPAHVFELSEAGLAYARVAEPMASNFVAFEPGVLQVSPIHDNIQQPQILERIIQTAVPANGQKRRPAALILPDYCARIAVLDFDAFPSDVDEQLALLRFRMKKTVPFDVDSAIVSHAIQPRVSGRAKVDVLAAVMASDIVSHYEAPFRAAGFHPGVVTTSSLATLNLLNPEEITMLVKLSGRILSVLVMDGSALKITRCVEMEHVGVEEIESVLHPTVAYIEDELKSKPERVWLCGFGAEGADLARRWQDEWGFAVESVRARFGTPGRTNAGLLGYLESVG